VLEMLDFVISMVGEKRVCIITNAEKGWITLSGQKFMPRLLQRVYQCNIVSARSTFEPFAPTTGPFEWKLLAFHMAAEVSFGSRFPKPTVQMMKPRLVVVTDQRREVDEAYSGEEKDYFGDDSSDSLSEEVDRVQDVLIDCINYEDTTDTEDNCIVQFSEECLNSGDKGVGRRGVSLSCTAAGNNGGYNGYGTASCSRDFLSLPRKTEMVYMPCDEFVSFPEIPSDYLKHSGFDFIPEEDVDKVLHAQKFIVSLGDSLAEKIAAQHIASAIPNTTTKTVKYMDRPNLDQLVTQTILVKNNIQEYLEMTQALDIMVNIPEQDMTSFERLFRSQKVQVQTQNEFHKIN